MRFRCNSKMDFEVCDVQADGSCFYRCLVSCALGDSPLWDCLFRTAFSQDQAIAHLRRRVARHVCNDSEARESLRSLILLHKQMGEASQLLEDHPLLQNAASLDDIAKNIRVHGVWASQVEVEAAKAITAAASTALVILEGESNSAADQLIAAIDKVHFARCIVMVRVDDCHYRFLRLKECKVFNTAWLIYAAGCLAMLEDGDDQLF